MMGTFFRHIKNTIEPLYNSIATKCIEWFYHLPIRKNKIVFIKGNGDGYACNPKYVAEEIIQEGLQYDMVWLVNKRTEKIPSQIRKAKFNRIKAIYELSTAHVIITNSKSLIRVKKKPSQIFIYIPHGQPGAKRAEGDAILSEKYIEISKKHSALTDVFVSMGSYHTQVLKDTFWVPDHAEIWECGFPRNDMYYHDSSKKSQELRKALNIPEDVRVILYAPTFRDNNSTNAYNLDLHRVLDTMEQKTGDKWMFFITLHPCFRWFKHPLYNFGERVWDMSDYTDIHELMLVVDAVITDYSSVALDFCNTRRPVFLYASDIDEYKSMRGLKEMYFKLPFSLSTTNDELCSSIMDFDIDAYHHSLNEFNQIYGSVDDGYAAERFVNKLKQRID